MALNSSSWQPIYRILLATALLLMVAHVIVYISFGVALIPFPFDYDQAEGFELNNAILLAEGGCPYCDNDVYPFYASGYAPFYHILMVPFVWMFGPQFWYGRLLLFLATLITAGAIWYAVWRAEKHVWVGAVAGMAFLASNFIYHIGPMLRQHLLMVMFETLAVVAVTIALSRDDKGHRRWWLVVTFAMLLFAGYTKQLAYSTCLAVGIWLFLRNPRMAITYSLGLIAIAGAIFGWAMVVTDGQWWINIISSNQNEYITEQFVGLLTLFVELHWTMLLLALLVAGWEFYFARVSAYSVWFVASLLSTIGAGKWGAGDSYFATTLVAACILAGIFVARSLNGNWTIAKSHPWHEIASRITLPMGLLGSVGMLLFVIYGMTVVKLPTSGVYEPIANAFGVEPKPAHRYPFYDAADWTVGYAVTGHFPSQADYEAGWEIVEQVRNTDGIVVSEDAGFVIQAGREVVTNPVQLRNLWENDLYDPTDLMALIENQDIGLIIRRADLFPLPILVAMDTHFVLDEVIEMNGFAYELWIPRE
ncbi:MAG: hypothetical protein AAFR81_16150 [Chloroflexota bacterium]